MYGTETYKDLIEMIEAHENILCKCKTSLNQIEMYLIKQKWAGCPKGYGHGMSYVDADCIHSSKSELRYDILEKMLQESEHLRNMIYLEEGILKNLKESQQAILNKLKNLDGLEYRVAYKKYAERKQIKRIWSELQDEGNNYSFSYIEKISAKV